MDSMDYQKDFEVEIRNKKIINVKSLNVTTVMKQIKEQYPNNEIISIKRGFWK